MIISIKDLFKKKSTLIIISTLLVIIISVFLFQIMKKSDKVNFKIFEKYKIDITVELLNKSGESENIIYSAKNDGKNILVYSSNRFDQRVYIVNKDNKYEILYKDDSKYLIYSSDYSLGNVYNQLKRFESVKKNFDNEDITVYDVKLEKSCVNELLKNLYLDLKVNSYINGTIIVEDGFITSFNFTINGTDIYEMVNISLTIEPLEKNYEILIPNIAKDERKKIEKNIFLD